jgi:hypothetical protein
MVSPSLEASRRMSPPGFGCVITRTSRECAELFSQFPSSGRCCSSFHIDEIEKEFLRNSSAKVFTQLGSSTDLDFAQPRGLLYHKERIWPARPVRSESCHQHTRRCTCVGRQRVEPLEEFHPTHLASFDSLRVNFRFLSLGSCNDCRQRSVWWKSFGRG